MRGRTFAVRANGKKEASRKKFALFPPFLWGNPYTDSPLNPQFRACEFIRTPTQVRCPPFLLYLIGARVVQTAGGLYFWSYELAGPEWGPFAAWVTAW